MIKVITIIAYSLLMIDPHSHLNLLKPKLMGQCLEQERLYLLQYFPFIHVSYLCVLKLTTY